MSSAGIKLGDETEEISWTFVRQKVGPLRLVGCEMRGFHTSAAGYGDGLSLSSARRRAFSEAWERLWMMRMSEVPLFGELVLDCSNGYAAGPTVEAAIRASREELIERALFLQAWENRRGWVRVEVHSWIARALVRQLENLGWSVAVYEISGGELGAVLIGLARHETLGAVCDSVFLRTRNETERKIARSLVRMTTRSLSTEGAELPEHGQPESHFKFYRNPKNLTAFEFLGNEDAREPIDPLEYPSLLETKVLYEGGKFPSVAVSYHPTWPRLAWGKQSIRGGNPWPHPLA